MCLIPFSLSFSFYFQSVVLFSCVFFWGGVIGLVVVDFRWLIYEKQNRIRFETFVKALEVAGAPMDMAGIECMLANLIDKVRICILDF
jgi:hypothetical protein